MEHLGGDTARLDRVEVEVGSLRTDVGGLKEDISGLKSDVRSFANILNRIDDSIVRSQDREDHRVERSKPNLTAIVSILVTLTITMIGGAYIIGGSISRLDAQQLGRDRELERVYARQDTLSDRLWQEHIRNGRPSYQLGNDPARHPRSAGGDD